MTSHLAKASELAPPSTSAAAAQQWVAAADTMMQQSASFRADYMVRLKQCEVEVEEAVQTAFAQLKQQARDLPTPTAACKQWLCYVPCIIGMMPTSIPDACYSLYMYHHNAKSLLDSRTWLWS